MRGKFEALPADGENILRLVLFAMISCVGFLQLWFARRHGVEFDDDSYFHLDDNALIDLVGKIPEDALHDEIKAAAVEASMHDSFGVLAGKRNFRSLATPTTPTMSPCSAAGPRCSRQWRPGSSSPELSASRTAGSTNCEEGGPCKGIPGIGRRAGSAGAGRDPARGRIQSEQVYGGMNSLDKNRPF